MSQAQRGFSLLELSVVLIIIALLVGASIGALRPAAEQVSAQSAARFQDLAYQALVNFALSNHRLPCPDTDGDGYEDECDGSNSRTGAVPFHSVGMTLSTSIENTSSGAENLLYGVYRNQTIDADLSVLSERTGDALGDAGYRTRGDFRQALINASKHHADNGVSTSEIHVTGNKVSSGEENCSTNTVANMAFVLISSGSRDMTDDNNLFDGVNRFWDRSGNSWYCAAAPSRRKDNSYDDTVVAINFADLLGLME